MKVAIVVALAAASASADPVRHVPPAEAEAGKQLELVAEAPATTQTLIAHVRAHGEPGFHAIELVRRDNAQWVAVVPAATVTVAGLDYYLAAGDQPVFATPEWPHTMTVRLPAEAERRGRDAQRVRGRRYKFQAAGELVEFGTKYGLADHYYRLDADVAYRMWSYPLEEIRVGYTGVLGRTQQDPSGMCPTPEPCEIDAGMKVGGWFELGLALVEGFRVDGRMIVMANQDGFAVGGRGEIRLGAREGSHVATGVEYLADVGTSGFFRLGSGSVPKLPMSATVEVTNLPAAYRDTGVRFYYDIARELAAGVQVGLRVGYAARNQSVAGFTGGAGASVEF